MIVFTRFAATQGAFPGIIMQLSSGTVTDQRLNILFVDDHVDTCRVVARLLTLMGHNVTTAVSVANALELAAKDRFQLLIADIGLPDGTGTSLLQELLNRGPILGIAVSGYSAGEDVEQSLSGGFCEHLVKPITMEQLQGAIGRACAKVATDAPRTLTAS